MIDVYVVRFPGVGRAPKVSRTLREAKSWAPKGMVWQKSGMAAWFGVDRANQLTNWHITRASVAVRGHVHKWRLAISDPSHNDAIQLRGCPGCKELQVRERSKRGWHPWRVLIGGKE